MRLVWAHPQPKTRRSCLRRMWLFETTLQEKGQERRAAVYREAPGPDCGCIVRFRPAGLARDSTLNRLRPGDEPVSLGQPGFAEGLWLIRRAGQPATEGSLSGRGRGGRSTGALSGLVDGQQGEDRSADRG